MIPVSALAGVDRLEDDVVAVVHLAVVLEALQPLLGRVLALEREHRAHDRLEVGAGRGERDPALPLRLGEVDERGGQLVLLHLAGVVDEHRRPGGEAGPAAVVGAVLRRDLVEGLLRRACSKRPSDCTSDIAGEFSVRKTSAGDASPSVDELVGQLEVGAVAQLTLMPVFSLKASAIGSISSSCWAL